ncbi:MAG: FAD-dependent oxidoreductase, partial [Bryobacteraceae bacterium]
LSTMPIREMIRCLTPDPPAYLRNAAADFSYRDFLTVALIVKGGDLFPDNWIYVHDSSVRVGRIQNYSNWSPDMVPDPNTSCLGLEYFCFEGDGLWRMRDEELVALAKREAGQLGLIDPDAVIRGEVVRMKKAYPVYDGVYARGLRAVRQFLETVPNLQLVGRNGMHRYNNQDHSMLTGILAAQNIFGAHHDIWSVNTDPDYHEDGMQVNEKEARDLQSTQPLAPTRL